MLPILVFSETEAKKKRGEDAEEMLVCPVCGLASGVLIAPMDKMEYNGVNKSGVVFETLVWERWQCLHCRNVWVERYGVGGRVQGVKATVQGTYRGLPL